MTDPLLRRITDTIDQYERSNAPLPVDVVVLLCDCADMTRLVATRLMHWRVASDLYHRADTMGLNNAETLLAQSIMGLHDLTTWLETKVLDTANSDE